VSEQCWRKGREGERLRPFCQRAEIRPRNCSRGLQRALVDFGIEHSFMAAAARFQEHYGWSISATIIRRWTLRHAQATQNMAKPVAPSPAATLITELDGSMIPIVRPPTQGDRRKNKELLWREVRVAVARRDGEITARYGATLDDAFGAGLMWHETASLAGLDEVTNVHALGDGAPWILEQCDRQFGRRATFLIDFHHVSDYLAAAGPKCAPGRADAWFKEQKERLRENRVEEVLNELKAHSEAEPKDAAGQVPPVRKAFAYIKERKGHLDYRGALQAGLPIGSGEVESAHRHIVQARFKKAGAWWRESNAQTMLQLRTLRSNGYWQTYWKQFPSLN